MYVITNPDAVTAMPAISWNPAIINMNHPTHTIRTHVRTILTPWVRVVLQVL